MTAIERHGVPDAKLPAAPPYFRFADPAEVKAVLEPAGFTRFSTVVAAQTWRHSNPDEVIDAFSEGAVRATAMLRSQPDDARNRIREVVRAEVCELAQGDEYQIPVPASLSVGFKES